ncbi:ribonuclease H2, subunit B [Vararia minispora EC-137]|uniref:Ribonuclease H2, subunit B n=1 Tax=Vararia minispora EC-137 TaxID=1314806 RepID=A0ACB8QL52_9AGAM|nr:ribonuclease H2, subunit B [Vararia minispora EC-137]
MATHFSVLPVDIIDTIRQQIENVDDQKISFVRLPHPRTGVPALFLPYLLTKSSSSSKYKWGILEAQSISPPNQRSWFTNDDQVVADGKLLIMTPIDPAFLLLRLLLAARPADGTTGMFQPLDDIFEDVASKLDSGIMQEDIARLTGLDCVAGAMRRICDFQDVTPEMTVYRYSEDKLMTYLKIKVTHLATPAVNELSRTIVRELAKDELMDDGKEQLLELGRTKSACNLLSQYLPPEIYRALLSSYDFATLDIHIQALRDEATAANTSPPIKTKDTNKGASAEKGEGKKRKGKATKASAGVEKLKKANTAGMAKLSTFFTKQ